MDPRDGAAARDGLLPDVRPVDASRSRSPQKRYEALLGDATTTAAPIFNRAIAGALSDRLDVQADHRARRPRQGPHHARDDDQRRRLHQDRRDRALQRRQAGLRRGRPRAGAPGLLRRLLLPARDGRLLPRRRARQGARHPALGAQARPRPPDRHRPARRRLPRRHDPRPAVARRDQRRRGRVPQAQEDLAERDVFAAGADGCGRSDLRDYNLGDNVNLAVGQGDVQAIAAADGDRLRGDRQRRQGRPAAPRPGDRERRPASSSSASSASRRAASRSTRPTARRSRDGLHLAASAPGGTSSDVFAGWPHDAFPVFGKTGTASATPKGDQSWYVAYVPDPKRPIVVAVTVEEGGFGAGRRGADRLPDARAASTAQDPSACARGSGDVAMNEPPATRIPARPARCRSTRCSRSRRSGSWPRRSSSLNARRRTTSRAIRATYVDPPGDLLRDRHGAR